MKNSFYLNKSCLYIGAAQRLMDLNQGVHSVVPHSAYYGCLLLMEHICYVEDGKKEEDLRGSLKKIGLHEAIISYFKSKFTKSDDRYAYRNMKAFSDDITELKLLRVKADYENKDVTTTDGQRSLTLAKEILEVLKKVRI